MGLVYSVSSGRLFEIRLVWVGRNFTEVKRKNLVRFGFWLIRFHKFYLSFWLCGSLVNFRFKFTYFEKKLVNFSYFGYFDSDVGSEFQLKLLLFRIFSRKPN